MADAALAAAQQLFSLGPILGMLVVLPIALISGLMPGGGLPVTVVVLSLVGTLDPWVAITVVVFQMAASDITEPVPSIMMGIPGARAAQATVLDGYPMARQGLAGVALGATYTTTLVGGIIGAAALLLALPISRELLRLFGSAEFFLLSLLGVMAVAIVSSGAMVKGMLTAMFGFAIAMIGYSPIGGVVRANFGIGYLWDGVSLIPVIVGLFALPEAIDLVVGDTPIAMQRLDKLMKEARHDVGRGMRIAFNHKWLMVRSSLIGTFVGMLPGLGASAAHWIAYAQARQTEKGARETFGHGDVRGIIAADAANNSSDGGVLIPTVVFGIPGSGGMAILLAMLILYGIQPGPAMLTRHLDLTISMVYVIVVANVIVVPIMLAFSPIVVKVSAIPPNAIAPVIIAIVTLAAFQASASMSDLIVVLAFGLLGIFMKRYGWPRPPILIAVVLGEILEKYLWLSVNTYGLSMLQRPQFLAILVFMILIVAGSLRVQRGVSQAAAATPEPIDGESSQSQLGQPTPPVVESYATGPGTQSMSGQQEGTVDETQRKLVSLEIIGEIILLVAVAAFFLYMFILSLDWGRGAALTPQIAIGIGTPFLILRIIHVLRSLFWARGTEVTRAQIMDMGFRVGDDPKGEAKRWVRILSAIGVLYLGIWLVGFHIALPLWTFVYMIWFGKTHFLIAGAMAGMFLGLIVGVYDYLVRVPWHDPVLFRLFS
jgi:TctA family transporter